MRFSNMSVSKNDVEREHDRVSGLKRLSDEVRLRVKVSSDCRVEKSRVRYRHSRRSGENGDDAHRVVRLRRRSSRDESGRAGTRLGEERRVRLRRSSRSRSPTDEAGNASADSANAVRVDRESRIRDHVCHLLFLKSSFFVNAPHV